MESESISQMNERKESYENMAFLIEKVYSSEISDCVRILRVQGEKSRNVLIIKCSTRTFTNWDEFEEKSIILEGARAGVCINVRICRAPSRIRTEALTRYFKDAENL